MTAMAAAAGAVQAHYVQIVTPNLLFLLQISLVVAMAVIGENLAEGQWIWDIRAPLDGLPDIAMARAAALFNTRFLMVDTGMAVGKMTTGSEVNRSLQAKAEDSLFLATGQAGIAITRRGIPLDAFRVDHAASAAERMVLEAADHDIAIVEGQGSLLHPGSTATLPLMRGSACTAMILCHRAGTDHLVRQIPCG